MGAKENFKRALRPLGALVGITGAAALVNRRLRTTSALPLDHIGGLRRPWNWRGYDIFATELGDGPPVLLIHNLGAGASSFEFRSLAPLLAGDHRVIALDLLGCGLSELPDLDYTPELFVELIVDALAEFCEGPAILVGSGSGGAFAVRAAARAPDRVERLVLIAPTGLSGVLDEEPSRAQRGLGLFLRSPIAGESAFNAIASKRGLRGYLKRKVYGAPGSASEDVVDHYYSVAHQLGARFVPAALAGGALNCNIARDLPFVEAPVLVLWGERASDANPVRHAYEFVRLARDGTLVTFLEAGVVPHEEVPSAVAAAIENFARSAPAVPAAAEGALATLFKSYDVRGIYPLEINEDVAYAIGRVFVAEFSPAAIAVGRDMRPSGLALFEAFARGATEAGANVIDVGLVSTDALYFAVGHYRFDAGVMITASHNPANYNGMKFTKAEAQAISLETGLGAIRDRVARGQLGPVAPKRGTIVQREILDDFAAHCLSFIDRAAIKPFKIAIDAGDRKSVV